MKFFIILFALFAAVLAAPQFGFSGSSANAQSGSFNVGGYPEGFNAANSAAIAQSSTFENSGFSSTNAQSFYNGNYN